MVIEPRKRQSKIKKGTEKSKFGTYLRYKRVSKYENQARIEQRVLYFIRNYDYNDQTLSNKRLYSIELPEYMGGIEYLSYSIVRHTQLVTLRMQDGSLLVIKFHLVVFI